MNDMISENKDNEAMRRRRMRLLQVRKQSNEIAKLLRERVVNEEQQRTLERDEEMKMKLQMWKCQRLSDLEKLYRSAVNDYGKGHKMAMEEPNTDEIVMIKQKEYMCKARERGENAMEQEMREKRQSAAKKMIPIQRKLITRKIEDLRSSLVRSLCVKNNSQYIGNNFAEKPFDPKLFEGDSDKEDARDAQNTIRKEEDPAPISEPKMIKNTPENNIRRSGPSCPVNCKVKKRGCNITKDKSVKSTTCKNSVRSNLTKEKTPSKFSGSRTSARTFWVNLDKVEALTEEEKEEDGEEKGTGSGERKHEPSSGRKGRYDDEKRLRCSSTRKKRFKAKEPVQKIVECYGYSLRHRCQYKDDVCSVRRIDNKFEPNANELAALDEEKNLLLKKNLKENKCSLADERGNKAIEKEKINRSYNELLVKLGKLSTKEKLIKSYCQIPPSQVFMSDDRRQEKYVRRQRMMDSKFERIYYDATGRNPDKDGLFEFNVRYSEKCNGAIGEREDSVTKLDFKQLETDLHMNSPASSAKENELGENEDILLDSPREKICIKKTPSSFHYKRTKVLKGRCGTVLSHVDRVIEKGRKLRRDSQRDGISPEIETKSVGEHPQVDVKSKEFQNVKIPGNTGQKNGSSCLDLSQLTPSHPAESKDSELFKLKNYAASMKKTLRKDLAAGEVPLQFYGVKTNTIAWPVHEVNKIQNCDDSWDVSSSTSYKSLPSEIHPKRINSLLKILGELKDREGHCTIADELIVKLEDLLKSLIGELEKSNVNWTEKEVGEIRSNPQLNYYIAKLLDMSRERIAELSVSSESETSSPILSALCNFEDDCVSNQKETRLENKYLQKKDNFNRMARMRRAKELEHIIKKWKRILEQNLDEVGSANQCNKPCEGYADAEDRYPCPRRGKSPNQGKRNEGCRDNGRSPVNPRDEQYEAITQRCSDRIAELANVLSNYQPEGEECFDGSVKCYGCERENTGRRRRDKRSGAPNRIVKRDLDSGCAQQTNNDYLDYCDDMTCPYRFPEQNRMTILRQEECEASLNNSLESIPNVMEELLKKNIITSPFHWTEGRKLADDSYLNSFCPDQGPAFAAPENIPNCMQKSPGEGNRRLTRPCRDYETCRQYSCRAPCAPVSPKPNEEECVQTNAQMYQGECVNQEIMHPEMMANVVENHNAPPQQYHQTQCYEMNRSISQGNYKVKRGPPMLQKVQGRCANEVNDATDNYPDIMEELARRNAEFQYQEKASRMKQSMTFPLSPGYRPFGNYREEKPVAEHATHPSERLGFNAELPKRPWSTPSRKCERNKLEDPYICRGPCQVHDPPDQFPQTYNDPPRLDPCSGVDPITNPMEELYRIDDKHLLREPVDFDDMSPCGSDTMYANLPSFGDVCDRMHVSFDTLPEADDEGIQRDLNASPMRWPQEEPCAGSCSVHCSSEYDGGYEHKRPVTSSSGRDAKENSKNWKKATSSTPNVRTCPESGKSSPRRQREEGCCDQGDENLDDTLRRLGFDWAKDLLQQLDEKDAISCTDLDYLL